MAQDATVILAEGLTKTFQTKWGGAVSAVNGLDLRVQRGETFGLIGPDGAGKSTTVRLLAGLLTPTSGRASVLGIDCNARRQTYKLKARIGYMSQQSSLYSDMTVIENLRFFANVQGVSGKEQVERIPRLLRFAGLEGVESRLVDHLSGGMKKKLALACMLLHDPEVVFLDEPTLGVDPVSRRELWNLLAQLRTERNLTTLVCTPYMDEAERCHRVALIYSGKIVAQDKPGEIRRQAPGQLLDCRPSDLRRAKELAATLPGVLEVQTLGDRLRIFVDDAGRRALQISAALAQNNIASGAIKPTQPGLEEAFISLVRRQKANQATAAAPQAGKAG